MCESPTTDREAMLVKMAYLSALDRVNVLLDTQLERPIKRMRERGGGMLQTEMMKVNLLKQLKGEVQHLYTVELGTPFPHMGLASDTESS